MPPSKVELLEQWGEAQTYSIPLDKDGKIVDFLEPDTRRENTPEERIRQRMAQVLHFELGNPKEHMALERTIQIGTERKRADILIFNNPESRAANDQGQIAIIGETKAPTVKEPDGQLISYISATSAAGGFWTNGHTSPIFYYRKNVRTGDIIPWLGIPKFGLAWDSIGRFKKAELIIPIDLKVTFRRCHNAIYRTGIDSEDVALDMVRVILAKIEDESSSSENCEFHITQEEFDEPTLRKAACTRVRKLFDVVKSRFPDVFGAYEEITASDQQLAIVISYLQQYAFLDAPYDVIGTAYEVYVASYLKGERGQYFTNRLVVDMMVRIADPSDKDIILDPACGSGGFLICAMNYLFKRIDDSKRVQSAKDLLKRNVCHNVFGIDTTPKLVKVAKANMLLSRDGHTGILRGNSLSNLEGFPKPFLQQAGLGKPSLILTNPPFGSGHEIRIKEPVILQNFKTGRIWTIDEDKLSFSDALNVSQGVAPELLFLERCIEWLRPGGVLGIVMAKGQLDNREAYAAREHVFSTCKVLAVINLQEDTFEPFVGSKASVIFLRKNAKNGKHGDYRIFMAISNKVGQTSRGEPIFKRDSEGNPIIRDNVLVLDEDLSEIAQDYHRFLKGELVESEYRFSISRSDIKESTLSLNPIQYLPAHNAALQYVLSLGDDDKYQLSRLGDIAKVFNGPRFKRPYAALGVKEGPTVRKYFTGTALTQLNSDNVKYLDSNNANKQTKKHLSLLTIYKGYILISDSGTLGRVTYALSQHDGHVATNNLIRVVIDDEYLRGYVFEFLQSELGQRLLLKNAYGTNQEHLEPDVIAEIPVPVPKDRKIVEEIGARVLSSIEELEQSIASSQAAKESLSAVLPFSASNNAAVAEEEEE